MQDSKKGARGVSTSTALYNSAGVLKIWYFIGSTMNVIEEDKIYQVSL